MFLEATEFTDVAREQRGSRSHSWEADEGLGSAPLGKGQGTKGGSGDGSKEGSKDEGWVKGRQRMGLRMGQRKKDGVKGEGWVKRQA